MTKISHTKFVLEKEYFAEIHILFIIFSFSFRNTGMDNPKRIMICIESKLVFEKFISIRSMKIIAIVSIVIPIGKESPIFSVSENLVEIMLMKKKPQKKLRSMPI